MPYEQIGKNEPVCIADEVPFEIPDSWEWVRMSSVMTFYNGRAYKKPELLLQGKYPVLRVGNLFTNNSWYYSDLELEDDKYCDKNDLLYAWSASFGPFIWQGSKCIYHYHIWKINHSSLLSKEYLYYYLMADTVSIKNDGHGVSMMHVTKEGMEHRLIAIPPFVEQCQIVKKIKATLPWIEQYDFAETKLTSLNVSFPDLLKKSILQQAVMGKLVPQDETDEPASILLERIRAEKERLIKEGKIKRDKYESVIFRRDNSHYEKRGNEEVCIDEEIPFDIPESWCWVRLSSLVQVNPRNSADDEVTAGFMPMPLLKEGFHNEHSFEEKKWSEIKTGFTHFANEDVVIAKITPCFQNRKSAVIANLPNGIGTGTTELHVLRDNTRILYMPYLLLIAKTNDFITNGVKNFSGTAGQQRVGKEFISQYLIPLPPLEEQKRIVNTTICVLRSLDEKRTEFSL